MLFDALMWVLFPGLLLWGLFMGLLMAFGSVACVVWQVWVEPWAFRRSLRPGKRWWQR